MHSSDSQSPIVVILPRGEAIRNFAYTGALEALKTSNRLSVFSVKPNDQIWAFLRQHANSLDPLPDFQDAYPTRICRELLDVAHGRWLWSEAAKERWLLRDFEATTPVKKLRRWGKKAAIIPFATRPGLRLLSALERASSRILCPTDHYTRLLKELKPALVFNGSHVHSANAIQPVQAAQWLGIPTATFIFSWDNLTSQGRVLPPYDYYLVWNDLLKKQLLDIYDFIHPEQVFVTGTPQFDPHFQAQNYWTREEFCHKMGIDPNRPIVLYSTGMDNHMPGEDLIIEGIAQMIRSMPGTGRPQLIVRIYPKDRQPERFDMVRQRCPDVVFPMIPWERNFYTPAIEDTPLLTNMIRHAAVGINIASTVSLEFCMMNKPVINVAYNPPGLDIRPIEFARYYEFDHYRPVAESGAVVLARSPGAMKELLHRALSDPSAGQPQRRSLVQQMFGASLDGRCGTRIAELLSELATPATKERQHVAN